MQQSTPTMIPPRADGSPRRVLYAEDQTTSRIVTKAMLERMGFLVDAVEDGELALNAARDDHYDVILLDIEMPVMDGVTAARSIREELPHCNETPILALSAFIADSTEQLPWRGAFDSALLKPANTNELFNAMHAALALRALQKPGHTIPAKDFSNLSSSQLPRSLWTQIRQLAAVEMNHLANAMAACGEARDTDGCSEAGIKLSQLASSFGAIIIADCAMGGDMQSLQLALKAWTVH